MKKYYLKSTYSRVDFYSGVFFYCIKNNIQHSDLFPNYEYLSLQNLIRFFQGIREPLINSKDSVAMPQHNTNHPVKIENKAESEIIDDSFGAKNASITVTIQYFKNNTSQNISIDELKHQLLNVQPLQNKLDLIKEWDPTLLTQAIQHCTATDAIKLLELFEIRPLLMEDLREDAFLGLCSTTVFATLKDPSVREILNRRVRIMFTQKLTNTKDITDFIKVIGDVRAKEIIKSFSFSDSHRISTLIQNRPEFYESLSDEIKIHELGHRLGLEGDIFEGLYTGISNISAHHRFNTLQKNTQASSSSLNFRVITDTKLTSDTILENLNGHGSLEGIHAKWPKHDFSFHFVKDKEKTHIVYVNRGQRHESAGLDDPAVLVFTIEDDKKAQELISQLHDTLKTENREKISIFIKETLGPYTNESASRVLAKSNQKVGNCSIANANITWHFKLASDLMKNEQLSFAEAYEKTRLTYKSMRTNDRVDAFCSLVSLRGSFNSSREFEDAMIQSVGKITGKNKKNPENNIIPFLLNKLNEQNPEDLKLLFNVIIDDMNDPDSRLFELVNSENLFQWLVEMTHLLPDSFSKTSKFSNAMKALMYLPSTDLLEKILSIHPEYTCYIGPAVVRDMNQLINKGDRVFLDNLLSKADLPDETWRKIASKGNPENADGYLHLFLHKPDLISDAKPDLIKKILQTDSRVLSKEKQLELINHLNSETRKELMMSLDENDSKDSRLASQLRARMINTPVVSSEFNAAQSENALKSHDPHTNDCTDTCKNFKQRYNDTINAEGNISNLNRSEEVGQKTRTKT